MKVFLLLAIAIFGAESLSISREIVNARFEDFKKTFAKTYANADEEAARKAIFQAKLEHINEHNEKYVQGLVSYQLEINDFADMTEEELRPYTHGLKAAPVFAESARKFVGRASLGVEANLELPESFDWRDYGIVTPVKNQGGCGACWAFSANGALEAQMRKAYGADYQVSLSEQQLVDCIYDDGCAGGWMDAAYNYTTENGGLDSDSVYPYEAVKGDCRYRSDAVAARVAGYVALTGPDENILADMVYTHGPASVSINADGDFGAYSSGVYYNPDCDPEKVTHAVVIVGYGNENGQDYWLVKNSWGENWGQNGYIKMARNAGNHCGIASHASCPLL